MTETKLINGDENNAIQCKSTSNEEMFYYTVEIRDDDITPKLKQVIADMKSLKAEHDKLVEQLAEKARKPHGWGVDVHRVMDWGYLEAHITKKVYKINQPAPQKPYVAPPEPTKLEKILRLIDAKTLFNSGILTNEEKRELLDLPSKAKLASYQQLASN